MKAPESSAVSTFAALIRPGFLAIQRSQMGLVLEETLSIPCADKIQRNLKSLKNPLFNISQQSVLLHFWFYLDAGVRCSHFPSTLYCLDC